MPINWQAVAMELALFGDREAFVEIIGDKCQKSESTLLTRGTFYANIGLSSQITSPSAKASRKAT
jgi:hypothetical protein